MLSAHYRNPINFSHDLLVQARTGLERIETCVKNLEFLASNAPDGEADELTIAEIAKLKKQFTNAMDDDVNTADAISTLFDIVKFANTNFNETTPKAALNMASSLLSELMEVLGVKSKKEADFLDSDIEALIEERNNARKNKDFARADEIRDMLKQAGIILEDTRGGVKWKRA